MRKLIGVDNRLVFRFIKCAKQRIISVTRIMLDKGTAIRLVNRNSKGNW
jgi:hypothetical protein